MACTVLGWRRADFLDAKHPPTKIMRVESHHLHCDSVAGRPRKSRHDGLGCHADSHARIRLAWRALAWLPPSVAEVPDQRKDVSAYPVAPPHRPAIRRVR